MDTGHAVVGALLVLLCTTGVLSTQFLLWVAPVLAVVEGFRYRWLAVFLLTALIFPVLYQVAVEYSPVLRYSVWFLVGIGARNVLLVACTVGFLVGSGRIPAARPAPSGDAGRVPAPGQVDPLEPAPLTSLTTTV